MSAAHIGEGQQRLFMSPVVGTYDYRILAISLSFAVATAAAAMELTDRVAAHRGRDDWKWLCAGAIATGSGLSVMHLIGMLAYNLPIAANYHLPTLAASWLAGVFFCLRHFVRRESGTDDTCLACRR